MASEWLWNFAQTTQLPWTSVFPSTKWVFANRVAERIKWVNSCKETAPGPQETFCVYEDSGDDVLVAGDAIVNKTKSLLMVLVGIGWMACGWAYNHITEVSLLHVEWDISIWCQCKWFHNCAPLCVCLYITSRAVCGFSACVGINTRSHQAGVGGHMFVLILHSWLWGARGVPVFGVLRTLLSIILKKIYLFKNLFLAVLSLRFLEGFFSSCGECGLLLWSTGSRALGLQWLWCVAQ